MGNIPPDIKDQSSSAALSIGIIPLPRFTLAPFASFLDALRLAADKSDRSEQRNCSWQVMSPGHHTVTSSASVSIAVNSQPPDPRLFDYIAVFGGLLGEEYLLNNEATDYLRRADQLGVPLIGVCTGSYALIEAGLMEGRTCCVNWFHHRDYLERFGDIPLEAGQLFIEDGDRITCSGGSASADLALWLIRKNLGERWAKKCQRIMLLEEIHAPKRSQPLPSQSANVTDPVLRQAVLYIECNISEQLNAEIIAENLAVGRRQLERKFKKEFGQGPQEFIRTMRFEIAENLVLNTSRSLTDISYECGFSNYPTFAASFKKRFGDTPKLIRERASADQS